MFNQYSGVTIILIYFVVTSQTCTCLQTTSICQTSPPASDDPCVSYSCNDGVWTQKIFECQLAQCADYIKKPEDCCTSCPNGPNCLYSGVIIPLGQVVTMDNGDQCQCEVPNGPWSAPETFCVTPPKPPEYYY